MSAVLPRALVRRLNTLLRQAARAGTPEPAAATLATVGAGSRPSARTVLIKGVDARGVVFFTSLHSRKARQMARHPAVALAWHSQPLRRQALLEGRVTRVRAVEADAYWRTRPRDSQLGAWASAQSQPLKSRAALMRRWQHYRRLFRGRLVPRPAHWTGFRMVPQRIEFWRARAHRLHERVVYLRQGRRWQHRLLGP